MNVPPECLVTVGELLISRNILGQVTVLFSLHDRDWQILEKSEAWEEILQLLEESEKESIRSYRPVMQSEQEMAMCRNHERIRVLHRFFDRLKRFWSGFSHRDT